ncbi:NPCC-domain-containing protein [Xylaria nigripes]|nr:NPCC-domain-containing protein [Xylaria nigripes]
MAATAAQTALSTPIKAPATPTTESPGTWRHPRLQEINRRQAASTFTEKNIKRLVINICLLIGLTILHSFIEKALPPKRSAPHIWAYFKYTYYALQALPLLNIFMNLLPLIRAKDDLSDIPLTPGQRKLMGLPPASNPPTPGSVFSTPPRYARTPSASGSAASRRSLSSSPVLARSSPNSGTPTSGVNGSSVASPSFQLLQKAVLGARRSSFSSPIPTSSISTGSPIYGSGPETRSPSPAGKRSSLGVSSKWRYNKGMYDRPKGFRDSDFESVFT